MCALFIFASVFARPEQYTRADRDFAQEMLKNVAADVQKHYYDPKLHDVDWNAKVQEAKKNIDSADSISNAVSKIAAPLDTLNDSHTLFYPPPRTTVHDYRLDMEMIGDHCFVTRLHPGSDAEKKGLKVGDEILAVNEHPVSRSTLWRIQYIYNVLRPQPGLRLALADVTPPAPARCDGQNHYLHNTKYFLHQGVNQRVRDRENAHHSLRARYFEKGDELLGSNFLRLRSRRKKRTTSSARCADTRVLCWTFGATPAGLLTHSTVCWAFRPVLLAKLWLSVKSPPTIAMIAFAW